MIAGEGGPRWLEGPRGAWELTSQTELASDGAEAEQAGAKEQQCARLRRWSGIIAIVIAKRLKHGIEQPFVQNDIAARKRIVPVAGVESVEIVEGEIGMFDSGIGREIQSGEMNWAEIASDAALVERKELHWAGACGARNN